MLLIIAHQGRSKLAWFGFGYLVLFFTVFFLTTSLLQSEELLEIKKLHISVEILVSGYY